MGDALRIVKGQQEAEERTESAQNECYLSPRRSKIVVDLARLVARLRRFEEARSRTRVCVGYDELLALADLKIGHYT